MFFTSSEKKLSALPDSKLKAMYEQTEMLLNQAAKSGKVKNVKKAMREHHTAEYAMLYKKVAQAKKRKAKVVRLPQRNKRR